jgi:benzoyl-CoA reductase/2-hydroxyglutaryl-CoA dehydratase subunit BcrC/BadD/HgdB
MCDFKIISKISEEQLREIIEKVGRLRRRRKKKMVRTDSKKEELAGFNIVNLQMPFGMVFSICAMNPKIIYKVLIFMENMIKDHML